MADAAAGATPDVFQAAILGVIEGATEFIPVSSTGHLIVASRLLGCEAPTFEIAIQLGAILALTWFYRQELVQLVGQAIAGGAARRFVLKLAIAFLPSALVGLMTHDWIEQHLFRPSTVAASLVLGGIALLVIDRPRKDYGRLEQVEHLSFAQAIAVGLGQTLSLFPGVSRSGATIASGLLAGLGRRVATEFSFFLALPTMYAACLFALWKSRHALAGELGVAMVVGLATAFASALVVIRAFLGFVQTRTLAPFAWYRIAAGAAVAAWLAWS